MGKAQKISEKLLTLYDYDNRDAKLYYDSIKMKY